MTLKPDSTEDIEAKRERLRDARRLELLRRRKKKMEWELPHLFAFKWYKWAWDFYLAKRKQI